MIELGDRVVSKQTGNIAFGTVIAIFATGDDYCMITSGHPDEIPHWTELYPMWIDEPVIILKFDTPQKGTSKEEIRASMLREMEMSPSEELIAYEYSRVPVVPCSAYPEADLELWSD